MDSLNKEIDYYKTLSDFLYKITQFDSFKQFMTTLLESIKYYIRNKYIECIDVSHNLISNLYLSKHASNFQEVNLSYNKLTNLNLYGCEIYKFFNSHLISMN